MSNLEDLSGHTFSTIDLCAQCPTDIGRPGPCDHATYSRRYLRFVKAHREAFDAAYLDGHPQAARNELERLQREYKTLPPRHDCSCWPSHCHECLRLSRQRVDAPSAVEIGRTAMVHPPTPLVLLMDVNGGYAA